MNDIGCASIPYNPMHKMLILCMLTYLLIFPLGTISSLLYCSCLIVYLRDFPPLYHHFRKSFKPPDISLALLQARADLYLFKVQYKQTLGLASDNSIQFTLIIPIQDQVA